MNIQFYQEKNVDLPEKAKEQIKEQIKTLTEIEPKLRQCTVIIGKEAGSFLIGIYLKGPYKFDAIAKSKDYVLRTAVSSAVNKIKRQVIKYKEKKRE